MVTSTRIRNLEQVMLGISESIRVEALFASTLQPSQVPSAEQVRDAVTGTLRRLGAKNCAGLLAGEFGDHPQCAAARMTWVLSAVRAAYGPAAGPALALSARRGSAS